jgi:predicted RNase H-like nuclease (RuvC/YqgF family)
MATPRRPAPPAQAARLTPEIAQARVDQISLDQALRDVEVANARVIDLTRRLTAMSQEIQELRSQISRGSTGRASEHGVARDLFDARAEIAALRLQLDS